MSLYTTLQNAKSEEDVKDAYIAALGLKSYTKGLIDIQTKEIWFEAKDTGRVSLYAMFTQLLHYVQVSLNLGEDVPPLLAVIDTEKAAIMRSSDVLPFLTKKTVKWGKSASKYTPEALATISAHIGTHFVAFNISTHEDEFIRTVKDAIKTNDIIRLDITPDNLKQVFDKWVNMVGKEIGDVSDEDYSTLFFADVMSDGKNSAYRHLTAQLLYRGDDPAFLLRGNLYVLGSKEGYRRFWAIYHRPPKEEYRNYLLERRDNLIPVDDRRFRGAYYTPLKVVDKAYDLLHATLGKSWQKDYIVWDMCCGVGNLEVKHSNPRNIFMSTLDNVDIDVMQSTKTCVAATKFQYDYLNDDIDADGTIDYSLTNKIPQSLRKSIADGRKILVLINPPYAEAMNAGEGVAANRVAALMNKHGYASRELFAQFLIRIKQEIPNAIVAIFSKMKYITAPNFAKFRQIWNAEYLNGFVIHSRAFEGLRGNFPIGFLIWNTGKACPILDISAPALDANVRFFAEKTFYADSNGISLAAWIQRAKSNKIDALPLSNALTPTNRNKDVRGKKGADGAIGGLIFPGSDVQHSNLVALLSSGYCSAGGILVTDQNLWQVAIAFTVRLLIQQTWLNDRDVFTGPTCELSDEFKLDCLIWMLFNGQNLTASADGIHWNGRDWSLVNHFIPFTENEVGAPDRFESDFMVMYLKEKKPSLEAEAVLDSGRALWKCYFSNSNSHKVREEFKLNRADVGWYQIRNALKKRSESGDFPSVEFSNFKKVYEILGNKLRPQVFELGFLKE